MSKKTPQIRFKGFTDDWEERKLKDVLDISKTKNKAQQYGKVDVLSVSREVGTVNQIKYQGRSFAGSDLSNYKVVQGGELIYTKSPLKGAPYGIFQVATIKGILSPLYAVYTSTDKAYTPFVAMALKNDNIATHYLTPLVTKGAKNTINVTDEGALEGKIQFPSILEQKKIFIFFKQLDDTIALHQRKLDLLKEQKKGFLQKMFPKNGAKIPELRFEGFSDDWEERKLGDFVIDYVEKTTTQNQFPVLTSSQQQGIVLQETYFANRQVTTDNNIGYYVLPRGYFTFRNRSDNDVFIFNRNDLIDKGIISYFYPVFTLKNSDSDFFLKRINNGIKRQVSIQAEGTGQHVLSMKKFKNIISMFPSLEEQEKIGSSFKQLDKTIALHQRKLDLLKEQKKGFLQKMFVS